MRRLALGRAGRPDIPDPGRELPGFTLHETSECIRRAAISRGLIPVPEYPTGIPTSSNRRRRVDWVWLLKRKPYAAFEIEGSNVRSIEKQIAKLESLDVRHRFLVIYRLRHDGDDWRVLADRSREIESILKGTAVKLAALDLVNWLRTLR